jgi:xanthine dehydrogenase accessory factor
MHYEVELWRFVADRLEREENVMLLVVADSSGSSPGRRGYKMAVGSDGELVGSIGGGVMEVNLVNESREILSKPGAVATGRPDGFLRPQEHKRNAAHPSGMICSGRQTVIFKMLGVDDLDAVRVAVDSLSDLRGHILRITSGNFIVGPLKRGAQNAGLVFEANSEVDFKYEERLGAKNDLYIVGGGHCALALSQLMSKMDFYIRLFDDRPELNTLDKNQFAHEKLIIDGYETIGDLIPSDQNAYVVVMTLGYKFDEIVIRQLLGKDFKYFGVLGSKAKMTTLMNTLRGDGFPSERLDRIHTPIGLPINSRTPEEIAVSIAAEIISIKNT